jgi:Arylsulfotransferase (ASST)
MRAGRSSLAAVLGALALVCAAPAEARVAVSTKPHLVPGWSPGSPDYGARCEPDEAVRVRVRATDGERVTVAGKPAATGTFKRSVKRASGEDFTIRVRDGEKRSTYHVRCMPDGFPSWAFHINGRAQAQWYVVTPLHRENANYVTIVDRHGAPVWWWRPSSYAPSDGKVLPDGTIAWTRTYGDLFGLRDKGAYEVRRPDGSLVRVVRTVGSPTDTHDMQPAPNGNYLAQTYRRRCCEDLSQYGGPERADVFDGEIQEIAPDGRRVWRWNSGPHIPPSWTTGSVEKQFGWMHLLISNTPNRPPPADAYDLVHINSMEPDGDGLIVSARHIDSVFRIDRATGEIDWKLGGRNVPGKSLKILGPHPTPLMSGQHDARLWKDGTVTVYDNGTWHRPPSAMRFAIDPVKRTARLLERITNPAVKSSRAIGGARKLSGGNWVVAWGGSAMSTEQTEDGTIVRNLYLGGGRGTYRAVPVEPGQLSARRLRRGMDRMAPFNRGAPEPTASER